MSSVQLSSVPWSTININNNNSSNNNNNNNNINNLINKSTNYQQSRKSANDTFSRHDYLFNKYLNRLPMNSNLVFCESPCVPNGFISVNCNQQSTSNNVVHVNNQVNGNFSNVNISRASTTDCNTNQSRPLPRSRPRPAWITAPLNNQPNQPINKEINCSLCVRRIMILHDNLQFDEASKFIDKLSDSVFGKVLQEIPIGSLMSTFPSSVKLLETIYTKFDNLFGEKKIDIPFKLLLPDRFIVNLVKLFALHNHINETNSIGSKSVSLPLLREKFDSNHPVIMSSKTILKIIVNSQPIFRKQLSDRKASLDEALQGLGHHGPVGAADNSLTSLHDALRLEIESVIDRYRDILSRLEAQRDSSSVTTKKTTTILRSISRATSLSSLGRSTSDHQRLTTPTQTAKSNGSSQGSLRSDELQDRLIKNQILLNTVEPIPSAHQALQELLITLQQRINYDKQVLSQFNQLRREFANGKQFGKSTNNEPLSSISPVLMKFSYGYSQVLNLINEVCPIDKSQSIDSVVQSKEPNKYPDDLNKRPINDEDKQDESSDISGYHSGSEKNNQLYFAVNCQRSGKYDTIIHRSDYRKNRKSITNLFNESTLLQSSSPLSSASPSSSPSLPPSPPATKSVDSKSNQETEAKIESNDNFYQKKQVDSLVTVEESQFTINQDDIICLKEKLNQANKMINELKEREAKMKDRLANQAQNMLSKGTKFENLCFNEKRPTALIRRYGNLYAQARVDTLDALDNLNTLKDADELKSKLLFSLVVLSFCSVEQTLTGIKQQMRKILSINESTQSQTITTAISEIDSAINSYLRVTVDSFDPRKNVEEVLSQICATLYDYPCLRNCDGLLIYIRDCVTLAWALTIQSPSFVIEYGSRTFKKDYHIRFHTSNQDSDVILSYLWPSLLEGPNGPCVHKGVVIT